MSSLPGEFLPGEMLPGGDPFVAPPPVVIPPTWTPTIASPHGQAPQSFTSSDGSIQGTMDGVNAVFWIQGFIRRAQVWRNGQLMTLNQDCKVEGPAVRFLNSQIPQPGDILKMEVWL
jgi:hypothetical protein